MTIEEAIAYWEVFQREIDLLYPLCDERSKATLGEQREPVALALSALRAQQQAEANKPLTLDETRKMNVEPVWFVHEEDGCWRILDVVCGADREEFILFDDELSDWMADHGKTWLAYRHKTEAHATTCTATNQPCAMCQPGPCGSRKEAHHGSN